MEIIQKFRRLIKALVFNVDEITDEEAFNKYGQIKQIDHLKIVGLVRSRNSAAFIEQALSCLKEFCDGIVFYDDHSTDNTLEIISSKKELLKIKRILTASKWDHDEGRNRNKLLAAGREIGGTHFICLDDDEILTANFIHNENLRNLILSLKPGDCIQLRWFQLWRHNKEYRTDGSIWGNRYYRFIFCDQQEVQYDHKKAHESRIPDSLSGKTIRLISNSRGVVHYNFANWENVLVKQFWYMCLERTLYPEKPVEEINNQYGESIDETGLETEPAPSEWWHAYDSFSDDGFLDPESWRRQQVLEWFKEFGTDYFSGLNIWEVVW